MPDESPDFDSRVVAVDHPRIVRDLLPEKQRYRAHNLCRLPSGYRLLQPFENIVGGCKFTRPDSPEWVECYVGEIHRGYDPDGYFIHCIPNAADLATAVSNTETN